MPHIRAVIALRTSIEDWIGGDRIKIEKRF